MVLQPAAFSIFDLSSDKVANVGTTLGGIIGPIVSMYSVYLLYEALTAQLANNKEQRLKSNSDILFVLLNQLDKEYDSFVLKQTKGEVVIELKGYDGIAQFCYLVQTNASQETFNAFKTSQDGNKIMYLIRSFVLIYNQVQDSDFGPKTKGVFQKKLQYYYRAKFKFPVLFLTRGLVDIQDELLEEIRTFKLIYDVID